ncbi:hypothetical protein CERSUDRAFT_71943 [Gelatoporia subvermispora B]|uniref:Uncharacterized protein n=1 Tax=Ceriporiopsis subvermispora (strain B) TaxID=914234 RepID=M2RNZ1_CERS8|nr:hypothetical protein CERSUDRAFT_71943 [Gelatoporia subvermispora B]
MLKLPQDTGQASVLKLMDNTEPYHEETKVEVDSAYFDHYCDHLSNTRAHLAGRDGLVALPASLFPLNTYWTSAEKDIFFHALTVHSRLRPDLIADEIKTKSVADVCVYLDLLEEASSDSPLAPARKSHPMAFEVSDKFVAHEDDLALKLASAEPKLEELSIKQSREEEIRARRMALRARKGQARTAANERDREGEKLRKKEFKEWLEKRNVEWDSEQALTILDFPMLKALDHILREDDKTSLLEAKTPQEDAIVKDAASSPDACMLREPSTDPITLLTSDDVIGPTLLATSTTTIPSEVPMTETPVSTVSIPINSTFQPVTPPFQAVSLPAISAVEPLSYTTPFPDAEDVDVAEAELSPASRRRYRKRMYMRRKRALETGAAVTDSLERMKPGRRPKKRLAKDGRSAILMSGVPDKTIVGAATGPGAEARQLDPLVDAVIGSLGERTVAGDVHPTASAIVTQAGSDTNRRFGEGDISGGEDDTRHPHLSGATLPYKTLARLETQGITAEWLRLQGLELLHLRGISKLMRLYKRLDDEYGEPATQIHASVIRLLSSHVVDFVARAIHSIVVVREQERLAKLQTKVWRLAENQAVTVANIHRALEIMGHTKLDKAAHFEALLECFDDAAEDEPEDEQGEECDANASAARKRRRIVSRSTLRGDDEDADDENEEDSDDNLPDLLLHRRVRTPFVRLPPKDFPYDSDRAQGFPHSSVFMPLPASFSHGDIELEAEGELVPDTDEEALRQELAEEEALSARDRIMEEAFEREFWAAINSGRSLTRHHWIGTSPAAGPEKSANRPAEQTRKRKRGLSGDEDGEQQRPTDKLRYVEPDPAGRVKSSVYVPDSD